MLPKLILLLTLAVAVVSVSAWPQFLSLVPNANEDNFENIIDIGHRPATILRNPFGLAFGVGRNWTKELCQADSDNDGHTNGQELGDPCCVWSPGRDDLLQRTANTSNPGYSTSKSDPSLWKNVDCTAFEKKAAATKTDGTQAPTASGDKSSATGVSGAVASVLVMTVLVQLVVS